MKPKLTVQDLKKPKVRLDLRKLGSKQRAETLFDAALNGLKQASIDKSRGK